MMEKSDMNFPLNQIKQRTLLVGCDTFVALYPTTRKGFLVFGKNSDRPTGEGQSIRRYPAKKYHQGETCDCTYISIPQSQRTHAVLLSQIDWMWGAEHGTNEHGVVVGNEAVWTKVNDENLATKRLLGMDLVRLGLERGSTAKQALDVITALLEIHGQGGPCAQDDPSFVYHNSFLIADRKEAWVLETAGRNWVAKRTNQGATNISNTLTIRNDYDLHSKDLREYASDHQLIKNDKSGSISEKLDWAECFGDGCVEECESPYSRQSCGRRLLKKYDNTKTFDAKEMMKILKSHDCGLCMHGGFETTASIVTVLKEDGDNFHQENWMLDKPHPCQHEYTLEPVIKL